MEKYIAYATIKNSDESWEEDLEVSSEACAEQDWKAVVQAFNDSLKPGELPREFVSLLRVETVDVPDPSEEDDEYGDDNDEDWHDLDNDPDENYWGEPAY